MVVSRIVRALHPVEFVFYCAFSLKVERSAVRVRQPWPERERSLACKFKRRVSLFWAFLYVQNEHTTSTTI